MGGGDNDTQSDYYQGKTHKINGKVMGLAPSELNSSKVTLYLDDQSEPIATADVDENGNYTLEFTPEVHANIEANRYALLDAKGGGKSFKSIVTFYSSTPEKPYGYKDTKISAYTDAIYKIKKSLKFDKNATKKIVKEFITLYDDGKYTSTSSKAYAFAYNGVLDELAEHNEYNNTKVFKTIQKLSTLNKEELERAKENKANKYAFAIVQKIDDNMVVQEVTLDVNNNLKIIKDSTTYTLKKKVIGEMYNYDGANHYEAVSDNENMLKAVRITTLDSNLSQTEIAKGFELPVMKSGSKTFIIKNLRIQSRESNLVSKHGKPMKQMKGGVPLYKGSIYVHDYTDDVMTTDEEWIHLDYRHNIVDMYDRFDFNQYLDGYVDRDGYVDNHRAIMVKFYDEAETWVHTRYYFNDYDYVYEDATVAARTVNQTTHLDDYSGDKGFDNNFESIYEDSNTIWTAYDTYTHSIMDLDKIVSKDFAGGRTRRWKSSLYAQYIAPWWAENESEDTRKPLLLIHGWQAVKVHAERNPAILRDYEHNEFDYWHNFISYYLSTPALYNTYKLYTYHYTSYKHITYNGRILTDLLNELKSNNNTLLGYALNFNNKVTIIGHSMGGLVARSMIEEHKALGNSAERLARLITLDTPHHGSHGANQAHISSDIADYIGKKDLATAGAVDLIWDNYDYYYSCKPGKECDLYKETVSQAESENDSRYNILNDGNVFDAYYRGKINASFSTDKYDAVNPYLAYLNKNFRVNWSDKVNSVSGNSKYIFYVAHSSSDYTGNDEISNPIDTTWAYIASTRTFNSFGYGSGGAEPVCSAFLTTQTNKNDEVTRFSGDFESPEEFIKINNDGVEDNGFIAYRYFWDYDHQSMLAGRSHNNKDWDIFIDDTYSIEPDNCDYSSYYDFAWFGCETQHFNYHRYAENFLYGLSQEIDMHTPKEELSNPLTTEPVFMILQKDLTNIN